MECVFVGASEEGLQLQRCMVCVDGDVEWLLRMLLYLGVFMHQQDASLLGMVRAICKQQTKPNSYEPQMVPALLATVVSFAWQSTACKECRTDACVQCCVAAK